MIKHIESIEQFNAEIKEGKVLVDFFATWCGPCKMLAPELEDLDREGLDLKIIKVDVDELPALAGQFRVSSIPSLFLLENGKAVKSALGYRNKNQLLDFLNN